MPNMCYWHFSKIICRLHSMESNYFHFRRILYKPLTLSLCRKCQYLMIIGILHWIFLISWIAKQDLLISLFYDISLSLSLSLSFSLLKSLVFYDFFYLRYFKVKGHHFPNCIILTLEHLKIEIRLLNKELWYDDTKLQWILAMPLKSD